MKELSKKRLGHQRRPTEVPIGKKVVKLQKNIYIKIKLKAIVQLEEEVDKFTILIQKAAFNNVKEITQVKKELRTTQ